jgi:hypothetical protein
VKKAGSITKLPNLSVDGGSRFCRDSLLARASLHLQRGNLVADGDEHIAEFAEFRLATDGLAMACDDDSVVVRHREIGIGCGDKSMLPPVE